jgi:hypothetical protein
MKPVSIASFHLLLVSETGHTIPRWLDCGVAARSIGRVTIEKEGPFAVGRYPDSSSRASKNSTEEPKIAQVISSCATCSAASSLWIVNNEFRLVDPELPMHSLSHRRLIAANSQQQRSSEAGKGIGRERRVLRTLGVKWRL